jgi:hypothetical protein
MSPERPRKKSLKEESWKRLLRISWRRYYTWLTRRYKMFSKNFKTPQITWEETETNK